MLMALCCWLLVMMAICKALQEMRQKSIFSWLLHNICSIHTAFIFIFHVMSHVFYSIHIYSFDMKTAFRMYIPVWLQEHMHSEYKLLLARIAHPSRFYLRGINVLHNIDRYGRPYILEICGFTALIQTLEL